MFGAMVTRSYPPDPEVREALVREAGERIRDEGPVAELAHLVVAAVVVLLTFGMVPRALLAGWLAVMAIATAYRHNVRHRILARGYDAASRLAFRLTVGVMAAAWGVGAALFAQWLPFQDVALLLVVLCGLVGGATATLAAERLGFRIFLVGTLLPPMVGIMAGELQRSSVMALALVITYGAAMYMLHERSHTALVQQLRTNVQLALSEKRAAWQQAHRDALFASAPVAIVVVDEDGYVRDANPQFEALFGYTASEARGQALNALVVPSGDLNGAETLDRAVRAGGRLSVEVERRHKDGKLLPVRASAAVVAGEGIEVGARDLFIMYDDMTDELRARRALQVAKDAAEHVAQMRSAFLANMSHEIRTPMNAILGLTELLLDGEMTAEQRRSLSLIQTSGEALLALLNDILDLSKIEAESLLLETIPFDLWRVVDSTTALLAVRAREKSIELLTEIPATVPEQVRGDPTRLRQVLTNLVGNAIKFTHVGEVLVSVKAVAVEDGQARIRFAVKDTGIGIADDQLAVIFQPFSQADLTMSRRYGGTGLGLTIAQRLVGMMGGRLEVASEVGKGSEFSFTLQLPVETSVPKPLPAAGAVKLKDLTMLVVDDNSSNRRIVREMLAAAEVTVREAADAEAGLAALLEAARAGTPYALVILDAQMPGKDGFQLAEIVRNEPTLRKTQLLMLTSAGQRGDAQRCRELGIRGYLTKPVSRNDLLDMVAGVIGTEAGEAAEVVTRHRIHESRRRLRILLAEDNPVNQEVAATMLRKRGHDVDVVENGRLALERAGRTHYDVVLMDIQMPEMDGYQASEAIRELPACRDLPIVALTAHVLANERERCMAHGMNAYLAKPFKAFELFAAAEGWGARPPSDTPPAEPPVDLEAFRKDMADAGAGEAVAGILKSFVENQALRMKEIGIAVAGDDGKEVARLAHAFKSSAAQIGARKLSDLLKEIETAAKAEPAGDLGGIHERLKLEAKLVEEYLKQQK